MIKKCHQVCILAFNDKFIATNVESPQYSERSRIPTLRLSSNTLIQQRSIKGKKWIDHFNPGWLSLQYVPFSFHNKGLPVDLGKHLALLGKDRNWQIMFHELWLGMEKEASLKYKLWGGIQKYIIHKTILLLVPKIIHTQSRLHMEHLKKLGFKAKLLPLYSNIEVHYRRRAANRGNKLNFLVFGTIYPGAPVVSFAKELAAYALENNKTIHFTFLGRCRQGLENWVKVLRQNQFKVNILGEQPAEKISEIICGSDWGISTTPFFQYEKSGTIAAMQEHGLPVYCVSRKFTPTIPLPDYPKDVKEYKPQQLDLKPQHFLVIKNNLKRTTQLFLEGIS